MSEFAKRMMAQKLMTDARLDPFSDSRFFAGKMRPSMADINQPTTLSDARAPAATASLFAPGAGIADVFGYAPDPFNQGQMLPSFGANVRQGNYLDAGLQTLGVAGDVLQAGGAFVPPLAAVGTALKAPRAARVASSSLPSLSPAIRSEGKILKGGVGETHLDVLTGIQDKNLARRLISDGENRGFVTEKGKYLSRDRAVDYALQNDLIDPRFSSFYSPDRYGELVADHLRKPVPIDPNEAAGAAMDAAQARYFETGKFEAPTAENPVSIVPPKPDEPGIIAFHGSGADFDEFRLEMIGTGEGAQAYGYGLYFTDSEDIAGFYKNMMTRNVDIDGKPYIRGNNINDDLVDPDIADDLGATNGDLDAAIKSSEEFLQEMVQADNVEAIRSTSNELEKLKQLRGRISVNDKGGKVYKVGLAPKPDELLDYDAPFSAQSKDVQEKLLKAGYEVDPNTSGSGGMILDAIMSNVGREGAHLALGGKRTDARQIASQRMAKAGIPGIKFLSGNTRNTAGGKLIDVAETTDGFRAKVAVDNRAGGLGGSGRVVTTSQPYETKQQALDWADEAIKNKESNYVIFDDKAVKILEKYGIVGPVAVTAAGAAAVNRGRNDNDNGGSILPDAGIM